MSLLKIWTVLQCFPKNKNESIPKGAALRLRRICEHSAKYQNYLITRNYKLGEVKNFFPGIKKLTRKETR